MYTLVMPDIAPEFQGQARRFRATVKAAESAWCGAIASVTRAALVTRAEAAQHGMRPKQFAAVEDKWRAIDPAYRLALEVERNARRLIITDVRLATMVHRCTDWSDPGDEDAVILARHSLVLVNGRNPMVATTPLASVGAHGVAQFFRRACQASDALLLTSLTELAGAADRLIPAGGRVAVDTAGGQLLGEVLAVQYNSGPRLPAVCISTCV